MKKLLLSLTLGALTTVAFAQQDTVVEEIVARVNNSIITRADLRRSQEQMAQEAREQNISQTDVQGREKNSLRDLIDQQLLIQKAQDLGITADTDLIKRLDELRKQMNAASMEDLQKQAEAQGVNWEDFKQNTKNNILTQKVISSEVGSHVQITRDEMQKFYDEHKSEIEQPERVRLNEILIAVTPGVQKGPDGKEQTLNPTPEQVAAAEQRANDVYKQLQSGGKFEDLAKKNSNGPTAEQGGDLGYFKRGMLAKELEEKTFALKAGEYTAPIRTRQGYVILKVADHIEAGLPPLNKVQDQIQNAIYGEKIQPALREYLGKLREDAYIDIKPGYTDTGASPNQTKLEYTSANAATPTTKTKRGMMGVGHKKTVLTGESAKQAKAEEEQQKKEAKAKKTDTGSNGQQTAEVETAQPTKKKGISWF